MRVIDGTLYGQRALSETVFSVIKRTLGDAVRARSWYREFREIVLMCAVYNIKRAVSWANPTPYGDSPRPHHRDDHTNLSDGGEVETTAPVVRVRRAVNTVTRNST